MGGNGTLLRSQVLRTKIWNFSDVGGKFTHVGSSVTSYFDESVDDLS